MENGDSFGTVQTTQEVITIIEVNNIDDWAKLVWWKQKETDVEGTNEGK